jgi:hypothetical protein
VASPVSSLVGLDGKRVGLEDLVAQLRTWLTIPKVNEVLLSRSVAKSAFEVLKIYEDLPTLSVKGVAMVTAWLLSDRYVRRRIVAVAGSKDRRTAREALQALHEWANVAATRSKLAIN